MFSLLSYPIRSFFIHFFSVNGGETRVFSSRAAGHSEEKAGFPPRAEIRNLWLGIYALI
ncbi:Uncharacterized protein dnm_100370 [Desulfonema magnum]|uniref:Uncharacterized protein n=1 Tax=Desulfonema magnum TaxID=45655 RepID=A0A975GU93_9BACT|nr:Uncharacterized protein dnm_100370 [Desulfonema magnum]